MIRMKFMIGSAIREVVVNGRTFSLISPELNFVPITINLDRIEEHEDTIKKMKFDKELIRQMQELETEEEIAEDIYKDFKKMGWKKVFEEKR